MAEARPIRPINDERLDDLQRWYPADRDQTDPTPEDTFEIALVVAGGQSAGCYSAGVLDYLFEALDAWHAARQRNPDLPNHHVRLKLIVGSSAGGLNSVLSAIAARYRFPPANRLSPDQPSADRANPFYRAWVLDIDVTHLLNTSDLQEGEPPASLLNSGYLTDKVAEYLDFTGEGPADGSVRAYLDDPLPVKITVANLDGVPYDVRFTTERGDKRASTRHRMKLHEDHVAFQRALFTSAPPQCPPDNQPLPQGNATDEPAWQTVGAAALATIAFPALFEQRRIHRPNTDYDYRFADFHAAGAPLYAAGFPGTPRQPMSFEALDGGVMNNEPFDLAHDVLAGTKGRNPRAGKAAKRAVILVDPFVDPEEPKKASGGLLGVIGRLSAAYKAQVRFKPIDLGLAQQDDVYSRFMVAPVREAKDHKIYGDRALASRPLMALLGYFSIHYRHHDYMLGRWNCHRFLRDWFVLPCSEDGAAGASGEVGNPLFNAWSAAAKANPAFQSQAPSRVGHRQIIPLVETEAGWPQAPTWPVGKFVGFAAIRGPLMRRLERVYPTFRTAVAEKLTESAVVRFFIRLGIDVFWNLGGRGMLLNTIGRHVDQAKREIDEA